MTPTQRQLAESHAHLPKRVSRLYHRRHGGDLDDMESMGDEVLCRCAISFNPDLGHAFSGYATIAMMNAFRDLHRRPRASELLSAPARPTESFIDNVELVERLLACLLPQERRVLTLVAEGTCLQDVARQIGKASKWAAGALAHRAIIKCRINARRMGL